MPGTDWPFTRLGLTFFESTLPRIARALEKIAGELEKENLANSAVPNPSALQSIKEACDEFDQLKCKAAVRPDPVVRDLLYKVRTALKGAKETE